MPNTYQLVALLASNLVNHFMGNYSVRVFHKLERIEKFCVIRVALSPICLCVLLLLIYVSFKTHFKIVWLS